MKPKPARLRKGVTKRHDDRLNQILMTAALEFAEHGYENTSLEIISGRLGMHKATLYHYVSGKEEILYLCQLRSFANLAEVTEQMKDKTLSVIERLRLFVHNLARAQNTVYGRCLLMVGSKPLAEAAGGEIRKFQRQLDEIVRDLLREGMANGELRTLDPTLTSAMLFGALNWVPRWYNPTGRYTVDDISRAFFDVFESGIRSLGGL